MTGRLPWVGFPGGTQVLGPPVLRFPGGAWAGGWAAVCREEPYSTCAWEVPWPLRSVLLPFGAHVRLLPSAQGSLYLRPTSPTSPCPSPHWDPAPGQRRPHSCANQTPPSTAGSERVPSFIQDVCCFPCLSKSEPSHSEDSPAASHIRSAPVLHPDLQAPGFEQGGRLLGYVV